MSVLICLRQSELGFVQPAVGMGAEAVVVVLIATEVTGVIASLHLTAGPVEMHHGMIGGVAGVHQLLLEGEPGF